MVYTLEKCDYLLSIGFNCIIRLNCPFKKLPERNGLLTLSLGNKSV